MFVSAASGATSSVASASVAPSVRGEARPSSSAALGLPPLQMLQGADLPRATAEFAADIGKLFRHNGISVPPEAVLGNDSTGRIRVINDHPDKARIERLFADDFDVRNRYMQLASAHRLQRAVEGYAGFVAEYQRLEGDVRAQAALVDARIARNADPFHLAIGPQGATAFFGGMSVSA